MNTVRKVRTPLGTNLLPGIVVVLSMSAAVFGTPPGDLAKGFPQLDRNFKVIDRPNQDYNCIAYTLGIHDQWIDPQTGPANAPLSAMDQLYGKYGYHRTAALDLKLNPSQQRVALYANVAPDGAVKQITHAALQGPDGSWTSKLGHLPLIRHASPYAVDGPTYGVPVATYVRDLPKGGANLAANSGAFRNGLAQARYGPQQSFAKPGSPFAGAFQMAGRNLAGNSNGFVAGATAGAPMNGPLASNLGAGNFAGGSPNGQPGNSAGFGGASLVTNAGIQTDRPFARAFRDAGRCCCGNDGTVRDGALQNGGFANPLSAGNSVNQGAVKTGPGATDTGALTKLGNAKNAGTSVNTLGSNQGACKTSGGLAQNVGNAKNAGNSLNALVSNGQAKNAGNTGAGNNRIGSLPGAILVNINGDNNKVTINVGAAKADIQPPPANANVKNGPANNSLAKNTGNAQRPAANLGNVKNAGLTSGLAGNAKNAGNALNSLAPNGLGQPKNTGPAYNRIGSLPGAIQVNINGNGNTVKINVGTAKPGAMNTHLGQTKNGSTPPSNTLLAKNAGSPSGIPPKVGNVKNAGNASNTLAVNGSVKNAGKISAPQSAKNGLGGLVANKTAGNKAPLNAMNSPGSLVGAKAAGKTQAVAKNAATAPSANLKSGAATQGPGSLVGAKAAGKTQAVAKNAGLAPTANAKNSPGSLVGAKAAAKTQAVAKNAGPVPAASAKGGAAKQGPTNLVGAKAAGNQAVAKNAPAAIKSGNVKQGAGNQVANKTTAPAIAKSAPNQPAAQRPANIKTAQASTPKFAQAKASPVANSTGVKNTPAVAKSLPPSQVQPTTAPNRGRVANAANVTRMVNQAAAPGRKK